jgi:hypothetical protein
MRLSVYAVFFLISSRLFATAVASASCGEGGGSGLSYSPFPAASVQTGNSTATAAVSCPLIPKLGYASVALAQSDAILNGNNASVDIFQQAAYASGSVQADYTLFVTGGSGTGRYMLQATGDYIADYVDTADFDIEFGGTQLSDHTDGFGGSHRVTNLYGIFTYGVPEVLPLIITARVAEFGADRRSGSASARFNGISIVNSDNTPNTEAIVSLQLIPEPSYAVAAGLLALLGWRVKPKNGRLVTRLVFVIAARVAALRASRITNLSTGGERSCFRPKFSLFIRRAAKMRAPRRSACERRSSSRISSITMEVSARREFSLKRTGP